MKITVALALGLAVGVMSKSAAPLQKTIKKLSESTEKEVKSLGNNAVKTIVGNKKGIVDKAQIKVNGTRKNKAGKRRRDCQRRAQAAAEAAAETAPAAKAALPQSMLALELEPSAGEKAQKIKQVPVVAEEDAATEKAGPKQIVFTPLEVTQLPGAAAPSQLSQEAVEGRGCPMQLSLEQQEQLQAVLLDAVQVSTPEKPVVLSAQDQQLMNKLNQIILDEEKTDEHVVARTVVTVITEAKNLEKPEEEAILIKAQLGTYYTVLTQEESEPAEGEAANPPTGSYRVKVGLVGLNQ